MKKILLVMIAAIVAANVQAQKWEVHLGAGTSNGKLLPMGNSTPADPLVHYGFSRGGVYLSTDLNLKVDEHSRFSLGYQFSESKIGVQLRPGRRTGPREDSYDILDLQNISVGYSWRTTVDNGGCVIGGFAKVGIAYGQMAGLGEGGSSGIDAGVGYLGSSRVSGFEAIPDFWTPTTTAGLIIGPNFKGRRVADRLMVNLSATAGLKNPYVSASMTDYTFITSSQYRGGTVQWQGAPLLLQVGLDYSLFRFGGRRVKEQG